MAEDIVDYILPLGWVGEFFHTMYVKKQLMEIFEFRKQALRERFGTIPDYPLEFESDNSS